MSLVSFKQGLKANLPSSSSSVDGALYLTTDTGELFAANSNAYTKVSDIVVCATVNDLPIAGTEISTKLYYVVSTNSLYKVKDGDWEPLGSDIFTDTTYSQGTGISITAANVINHSNSIIAGTSPASSGALTPGGTLTIPQFTYDAQGHITGVVESNCTLPAGAGQGSVTDVTAGVGLAGGHITTFGTIKANLTSETPLDINANAAAQTATTGRLYPVQIDNSGYLAVNVPWDEITNTITSINGQSTGAIVLDADDVGAVDSTSVGVASGVASLDANGKVPDTQINFPISTVNGQSGTVVLDADDVGAVDSSLVGVASGIAELDSTGKVPSSQLPSFVDDVIEGYYNDQDGKFYEDDQYTTEITPESGKIYVDLSTNSTYRWGGSTYATVGSSLALGETSSTAYRGDRGADAYAHAVTNKGSAFASGLYKITTNAEGHVTAAVAVVKSDITDLGIPGQDTTYSNLPAASGGTDVSLVTTGEKSDWNAKTSNTGTVTSVATGAGLTGGTITESGTIKANLVNEAYASLASNTISTTSGRQYAVQPDANGKLSVNVPWANTDVRPSAYCDTAAGTAAKVASCTGYALLTSSYFHIIFTEGNTVASALTLNINGTGAVPVYINNTPTSATNYTLPAGTYIGYYSGSYFDFHTDGTIPGAAGAISGITSDPNTVATNVAASAYLTNYLAAEKAVFTLTVANWSSTTTTVSGKAYYTYTVNVTAIIIAHPIMYLSLDTLPTDAQDEAWSGLKMVADTTNQQLTFYSESVPTVDIPVGVKGVVA